MIGADDQGMAERVMAAHVEDELAGLELEDGPGFRLPSARDLWRMLGWLARAWPPILALAFVGGLIVRLAWLVARYAWGLP